MSNFKERIKEIYLESEAKSVTQFAKEVGVSQRSMDNYVKGINEPGLKALNMIVYRYPKYNLDWLAYGKGPKFNSEQDGMQNTSKQAIAEETESTYRETDPEIVHSNINELITELKKSKSRLIERMTRRLRYAIDKCETKDEIIEELEILLDDLEIEKK